MISDKKYKQNNAKWLKRDNEEMCDWARNYIEEKWAKHLLTKDSKRIKNNYDFVQFSLKNVSSIPKGKDLIAKLKHAWSAKKSRIKVDKEKKSWIKVKFSKGLVTELEVNASKNQHANISEYLEVIILNALKIEDCYSKKETALIKKERVLTKKERVLTKKEKNFKLKTDRNALSVTKYRNNITDVKNILSQLKTANEGYKKELYVQLDKLIKTI